MNSSTLTLLERLIRFDTVSHNSNLELIGYVEDYLAALGFDVARVEDESGKKAGLFACIGPADGGVLLSAHSDVVPVKGQNWQSDPFLLKQEGSRLYGRGTTDMKGFLASMLSLAERASKVRLSQSLKFSISYDEEVGCLGIARMIEHLPRFFGSPRLALVGEPTHMKIAVGHKGKVGLRGIARGEAGHSSLAPKFKNALHPAADFILQLRHLQDWYEHHGAQDPDYDIPYTTVHVGTLSGGVSLNMVPEDAGMLFEFRHVAADEPSEILARIATLAKGLVEIEQICAYPGLATAKTDEVVKIAGQWADTSQITKVAFGTEAGFFSGLGIPTIVCGPGSMEGQGHKANEYIEVEELARCDAMMDRILATLCS